VSAAQAPNSPAGSRTLGPQGLSAILKSQALGPKPPPSPRPQSLSQTYSSGQDCQHRQDGLRLSINIANITFVEVYGRRDTPEGQEYLVTGEIGQVWLPPDACGSASLLRDLCQAYDTELSRAGRLATLRERKREREEGSPEHEGSQKKSLKRIKSTRSQRDSQGSKTMGRRGRGVRA
jgi:hypothetical protein